MLSSENRSSLVAGWVSWSTCLTVQPIQGFTRLELPFGHLGSSGLAFRKFKLVACFGKLSASTLNLIWLNMQTTDMVLRRADSSVTLKVLSYICTSQHIVPNSQSSHWVSCFAKSFTAEDFSCGMVAILICFEVEYLPLMACNIKASEQVRSMKCYQSLNLQTAALRKWLIWQPNIAC